MTGIDLINKAHRFAQKAHDGQKDDDGRDYFTVHLCHVANVITIAGGSPEMIAAAYLHDTVEDTKVTYDVLVENFGHIVADFVMELTHEGKKDQHGFYFPRLHSRDAIIIKLADRMSNLLRMGNWSEERQKQYLKRTKFWRDGKDKEK